MQKIKCTVLLLVLSCFRVYYIMGSFCQIIKTVLSNPELGGIG